MDMGGMSNSSPNSTPMSMSYSHMTFFWGKDSEILFSGWPGTRTGMYVLALIVVFVVSIILEWLSFLCTSSSKSGLYKTAVHGLRMAFAYVLMLAVMSFNVGVLLVAVAGHLVGFGVVQGKRSGVEPQGKSECGHPSSSPLGC